MHLRDIGVMALPEHGRAPKRERCMDGVWVHGIPASGLGLVLVLVISDPMKIDIFKMCNPFLIFLSDLYVVCRTGFVPRRSLCRTNYILGKGGLDGDKLGADCDLIHHC